MNCSSTTIAASVNLSGKSGYRADIDGLRATAVIAVIINHLEKSLLPSGYLGVDIFFVISGFVITSSLMNHKSIDFKSFLAGFYVRRFKRILPALILFTIISSLLLCLVNPNPGVSLRTGIAALFGFSNVYLLSQDTNYFSSDADLNIFTHTWSLGVEEQFYLIFPVLVWFSGLTKNASRINAFRFAAILSAFMLISWIAFKHLSSINPSAAFFLMPARFWELGSGSLCFLFCYYSPKHIDQETALSLADISSYY
jgi:peptidoglycan/LPS O-acetylase OafA/YrhL